MVSFSPLTEHDFMVTTTSGVNKTKMETPAVNHRTFKLEIYSLQTFHLFFDRLEAEVKAKNVKHYFIP